MNVLYYPIVLIWRMFWIIFAIDRVKALMALVAAVISRVCRFLSFLLPFKALIFALSPQISIELDGTSITNVEVALGVLVLALLMFGVYSWMRDQSESLVRRIVEEANGSPAWEMDKEMRRCLPQSGDPEE